MNFLRIMGSCFLLAGTAIFFLAPVLRVMGACWMGVGLLLLVISQVAARAAAHRAQLLATGKAGKATILEVSDTGVTVNNNPRVRVKVRIDVPGEAPIEATNAMMVSRVAVPDVGDVYEVRFDPQNPNDFAFAPPSSSGAHASRSTAPASTGDTMLGQLERLSALRDKGALTQAEFEAEKKKLLAKT